MPESPPLTVDAEGELVVFVTASSEDEATRIGRALVEAGLAACVNVVPRIRSIFRWQGKVSDEPETLMIVKTRAACFDGLADMVKRHHSYSIPEVIALPIQRGTVDYLAWVRDVTGGSARP